MEAKTARYDDLEYLVEPFKTRNCQISSIMEYRYGFVGAFCALYYFPSIWKTCQILAKPNGGGWKLSASRHFESER